jgi:hypothetical protein
VIELRGSNGDWPADAANRIRGMANVAAAIYANCERSQSLTYDIRQPMSANLNDCDSPQTPHRVHTALSVVLVVSGITVFFLVVLIGPLVWILRDGLGPDSTDSIGWGAVTRLFWTFYWGPATLLACLVGVVAYICRRRIARSSG